MFHSTHCTSQGHQTAYTQIYPSGQSWTCQYKGKFNKIDRKPRRIRNHETPDTRQNMISKEEMREDFNIKNKSKLDFFFPSFNNNFLSSSYLSNVNDYDIKEAANPKKHKIIKLNISPNKKNASYFDSFTGIEKSYNDSTTSQNTSWSEYRER